MKLSPIRGEPPKGKTLWYSFGKEMRVGKLIYEGDQHYVVCNGLYHYRVMKKEDKVLYDGFCTGSIYCIERDNKGNERS